MPSNKEHARASSKRTGKTFLELHKWMNEDYTNPNIAVKRHEVTNIPENIEMVMEKFGNDAVQEFLYHIKEDYENGTAHKTLSHVLGVLSIIKRTIFSPFKKKQGE